MKKWIHPDLRFEVQQTFMDLCARYPECAKRSTDEMFNMAKDIVETSHRIKWIDFQHKHGLGVFR